MAGIGRALCWGSLWLLRLSKLNYSSLKEPRGGLLLISCCVFFWGGEGLLKASGGMEILLKRSALLSFDDSSSFFLGFGDCSNGIGGLDERFLSISIFSNCYYSLFFSSPFVLSGPLLFSLVLG